MNIFILDNNIEQNVKYYCDEHSYKMQLEYAQILCTNYWVDKILGYKPGKLNTGETQILQVGASQLRKDKNSLDSVIYFPTHINHPCTIWARTSLQNTYYLYTLIIALQNEWRWRYEHPDTKYHKAALIASKVPIPNKMSVNGLTTFVQTMPDKYKNKDIVIAYRNYYKGEKSHLHWRKKREKPDWMT